MSIPSRDQWAAGLIGVSAAFMLAGYEMVRSASNSLFKEAYGPESLPIAMAATPLFLIGALFVYGRLISWLGPRATLLLGTAFSSLFMLVVYLALKRNVPFAPAALYVLREIYVVLAIEQYWSFMNSTFSEDSAKKLNGPVAGIASIGSVCGGLFLGAFAVRLGTHAMILWAAVLTLPALVFSEWAYRKCGEPKGAPLSIFAKVDHMGGRTLLRSRFLVLLCGLVMLTQVVSTMVDLRFQEILYQVLPDPDQQTAFSGRYFAMLNGVAMFFQFIAAPALLTWLPLFTVHLMVPLAHVVICTALLVRPSLWTAGAAYLVFKVLDYSVFRAAKEILYIPFPFDVRFRAKEVIDFFGYRFAKGVSSLGVSMLQSFGPVAWVALGASVGWWVLVFQLRGHHTKPRT